VAEAAAITSVSFLLWSVRWRILLNSEAGFSVGPVFCANMAGYLGNNFLPTALSTDVRCAKLSWSAPNALPWLQRTGQLVRHYKNAKGGSHSKQCHFCAEAILIEAKKCKPCGEFLDPSVRPPGTSPQA
jgi:hypothetical protein